MALVVVLLLFAQSVEELYRRGVMLLKEGAIEEAARPLEEAARLQPDWPFIWLAMADLRLRQNRFQEAEDFAQKAAKLAPADPAVTMGRAMLHSRLAKAASSPESTVAHWKEAIRLDPRRESYRIALGQFLLDARADKAAEAELRESVAAFPKTAEFHRLLGLALYAQGRNAGAIDAFIQAIDLDPRQESYYAGLETLLPDAGDRKGVILDRLKKFAGANPDKAMGPYLLALLVPEQSETLLRKAISIDARFWPAYFELHKPVWQRGDVPETIRLLTKVIELNPEYAPAHYRLAQAYAKAGKLADARREFDVHHRLTVKTR
jgi:tetratricopeptide (TPR) repeat protein